MKLLIFEASIYVMVPLAWFLFKRFAGRNVAGEMIAGAMIGFFNEFATEPLWDYHFRLTYYKDIPVAIILSWGLLFAVVVYVSEKMYCFARKRASLKPGDKSIFIFDLLAAALIAFPVETLGVKAGIWTYRYDRLNWDWGTVPFFNMPWEALFGYCLLMLIGPSFVRAWEKTFDEVVPGEGK